MSKELIERLRKSHIKGQFVTSGNSTDAGDAADMIESLRQQLVDSQKREVMLRERAQRMIDNADWKVGGMLSDKSPARDIPSRAGSWVKTRNLASLRDALADAADLDGLILCEKNPKAWCQDVKYEMHPEFAFSWVETQLHDFPLYRAWEPK
jgi:hypothetical protein